MVQRSMLKIPNVVLLFLFHLIAGFEYTFMDEKPDNQFYEDGDIKVGEQKFHKRIEKLAIPNEVFKRNFQSTGNAKVIPMYKTTNYAHCSCELNFQPIDLGREYYPRYLQTGVCQPNSCDKYYQCVERKYKIKVLRRRDLKDGDEVSSTLPKPLRDYWVAEVVPVGVACECVMDIQIPYAENV